jgi:hypothetical protein
MNIIACYSKCPKRFLYEFIYICVLPVKLQQKTDKTMASDRTKSLINISFLESNPQEARIASYLKFVKESVGIEVKPQIMRAVAAFFDTYAIGENPDSSPEQIEETFINSLNALSSELSNLDAYCRIRHGIDLSPNTWKRFGLLSPGTIFFNEMNSEILSSFSSTSNPDRTSESTNDE